MNPRSKAVRIVRSGGLTAEDQVAVEEPLEIRIEGRSAAVAMRTPGDDLELVAGFLVTEGVIDGRDDLVAISHVPDAGGGNVVDVRLSEGVPAVRRDRAMRELYASSSCGLCGKASLERVLQRAPPIAAGLRVSRDVLVGLPERLRTSQEAFDATGGLHASALVSSSGEMEVVREDVGRHNAVDKVVGWRLFQDRLPVDDRILLVSGRAGFEIVQKALVARIPVVAAVGAPSSLAVELAVASGMTLVGFLRDGRYNVYAGDA